MTNFTENAVQQMVDQDPAGPVVMLNLLRFRPDGGETSHRAYLEHNAAVWARYGVEPLYAGAGGAPLVAESGQDWDAVVVVRYPSRQAFLDMVRDPEYLANEHYRTDALTESVRSLRRPWGSEWCRSSSSTATRRPTRSGTRSPPESPNSAMTSRCGYRLPGSVPPFLPGSTRRRRSTGRG